MTISSPRDSVIRRGLYAAIPVLTLIGVYFATRGSNDSARAATHDHGAIQAIDSARPVHLSADQARRIGVTYAVATSEPLSREIRAVGRVTFDETRVKVIAPKIDGWVERLHVSYTGQAVRLGAPLFALYSPMVIAAQEDLLLAKRMQGRAEAGDAQSAELLSSARRRLAYWDVAATDIERIENSGTVERTIVVRSPASGFVIEKNVVEGQKIMAGDALYRLADLSVVWLEGELFEQDLQAVRVGESVTAELQMLPGTTLRGRIAYVYPTLNEETRTGRVRVEIPNPRLQLKPGMYATLRVTNAARGTALTVPRAAVLSTGERHLVFLKRRDGMLEPRVVSVGSAADSRVAITSGLMAGDTVVASATFLLDAESNLGTLLGGMGDMPGMDMSAPTKLPVTAPTEQAKSKATSATAASRDAKRPVSEPDHSKHRR